GSSSSSSITTDGSGLPGSGSFEEHGDPPVGQGGQSDCLPALLAFVVKRVDCGGGAGRVGGSFEAGKLHDQILPSCHCLHPWLRLPLRTRTRSRPALTAIGDDARATPPRVHRLACRAGSLGGGADEQVEDLTNGSFSDDVFW